MGFFNNLLHPQLRREFTVDLPVEVAWNHLACAERWPSWAKHIKHVEVQPAGTLGPESTGRMLLTNGLKPVWKMTEFNPHRNWKWVGDFLWLTVYYDHQFEALGASKTKITFIVEAAGIGVSINDFNVLQKGTSHFMVRLGSDTVFQGV